MTHYMPQHSNHYPWQSTSEESLTGQDCIGNTDDAGHSKVKKCVDNSSNGKGKAEADNQRGKDRGRQITSMMTSTTTSEKS